MSNFPASRHQARRLALFLAALCSLETCVVTGQGFLPANAGALPSVFVTATRSPQAAEDVLADVTVIGREEIERAGPSGLAALLQRQPGVEIARNGGPAGVSSLFLRGTNRGHAIVLIDGVRVDSATSGAATLEAIPLQNIERIEILRGPASGLYGADAIGGVVQVFTRGAGGALAGSASVGYGSYDTRDGSASASGSAGPVRFAVSGAHRASRGFNAITNADDFSYNRDRDGYASDSASARVAVPWSKDHEVAASVLRSRLNAEFDGGPGHDDRTITVVDAAHVQSRNRLTDAWLSRLTIAQSTDDSLSRTGFGDFPFRTREHQYAWLNDLTVPVVGLLTLGAERREERVDSDTAFAVTARITNAALALLQWRAASHALQANVRYDNSSQFGGRTTGGARYAYSISPAWQVTAAASTAFKAPTFNDLYYPGFSNPHLRPETAHNVEGGVTFRGSGPSLGETAGWEARAVAYDNRVRDLIVFQCDAQFNCVPQNVDRATLRGVTLSVDARRANGLVTASLDLADPTDDRTRHLLPRRARQHGALTASQQWGALKLTIEGVASSHRFDDAANTRRLGGYGIVNLAAEWFIAPKWSVLVRGDNVLDRHYELAAGYATGGATVFAALRWQS